MSIKKVVCAFAILLLSCFNVTQAQVPNAPTALTASAIGIKDFKLSWTAATGTGITGYQVFKDGIAFGTTAAAVTNLKITGLTFGTSYSMTVKATNATGSSEPSVPLVVTTFPALQINNASSAPVIDGNVDNVWTNGVMYSCNNKTRGIVTDDADLSGTFRLLSDATNLYLLTEVKDANITTNSASLPWQNDGLEMFLDIGWQAPGSYGPTDFQYGLSANGTTWTEYKNNAATGVVWKSKLTTDGYRIEASIPWATIGGTGAAGTLLGFDINIIDIDGSPAGTIDAKKAWYATIDDAYQFPYLLGVAKLTGNETIDTEAPTAPTALASSSITTTGFTVSWAAATDNAGVTSYEVYRDGVSVGTTSLLTYNVTGVTCATASSITVKAKDAAGNVSPLSSALSVSTTACDVIAPSAPTGLAASNITSAAFTVSWTAATDNVGVTGYEIYRNGVLSGTSATTTFNLTGLTCETSYSITVKAKDAGGNLSTASAALDVTSGICVDATAPSVPAGLTATAITVSGFTLNWAASSDNVGVTGYEVYRNGILVGSTTGTAFNIDGLICERISAMTVKAKDLAGNISASSAVFNATTASCAVVYEAEDAVRTGGTIAATEPGYTGTGYWTNVTAQGNAVEFTVSAATTGKKGLSCRHTAGSGDKKMSLYVNGILIKQITFASTGNWQTWTYETDSIQVNAGNNTIKYIYDAGDDGNINIDHISFNGGSIDIDPPSVPTGLTYSGNTTTSFTLSWNPSTDNVETTGYEVFKDGVSVGTTTTATSLEITGLACGFYSMTVTAKDAADNVSEPSAVLNSVTVPCTSDGALYVYGASTSSVMDGTFLNPYHTIQQAVDVAVGGNTILVREGTYREEIKMKHDSITYTTFNNETVIINGTDIINTWEAVPGGNVFKTNMAWNAEVENQFFIDQKMVQRMRWPDQTSLNMNDPTDAMAEKVEASGNNFIITDNEFNQPALLWVGADIWVNLSRNGNDGQGWTGKVVSVSGNTITVNFNEPPRLGEQPWSLGAGTQYYLTNPTLAAINSSGGISALLDKGEWYKTDSTLYIRTFDDLPPSSTGTGTNIVEAKKRQLAFKSSDDELNRSSYTIKNFNLFACSIVTDNKYQSRNKEIVEDAHDIVIDGIKATYISHFYDQTGDWQSQWTGNTGLVLSGRNNVLKNSTFQYSAGPAVCMVGYGNKVLNNTILDANYSCSNSGAMCTGKCYDGEIAFNTINNTPSIAISYRDFLNANPDRRGVARIHHNKITNFLLRSWDSGAIDAAGLDVQWMRIDHNVIYNTYTTTNGNGIPNSKSGIYCDFGGGPGVDIGRYILDHNVIYDLFYPILINNVKKVNIYNNVLLSISSTEPAVLNGGAGTGLEDTIRNNIMSTGPNLTSPFGGATLRDAVIENNIIDAQGAVADEIFTDTLNKIFTLKSSAINAIDQGVDFSPFNDPITGTAVDLGAYEFGAAVWYPGTPALPNPKFVANGGEFYDSVTVSILSDSTGPGLSIRYTIDGSDPTATSPLYSGPIKLLESTLLKARVFSTSGIYSTSSSANFVVYQSPDASTLRNPENPEFVSPGVVRNYYEFSPDLGYEKLPNLNSLTPVRTDTVSVVGLYPEFREDNFIFQFKGYIDIPSNGIYKFYTTSDDASKFYIGDSLVVDNDILQPPTEKSGTIGLKKGKHIFTAQFMEAGGGQVFDVDYQGPGITRRNLPAPALYYNNTPLADVSVSPLGGTILDQVLVSASSSYPNAIIYYTIDGTEPGPSSNVYSGPVLITNSATFKAVAYLGTTKGLTTSADFTIEPLTGGSRAVLFPNPSNDGRFKIKFKNPGQGQKIGINIFDTRGRSVYHKNINVNSAGRTQIENFDLPFLKPAVYIVSIKTVSSETGNRIDQEINLIVK